MPAAVDQALTKALARIPSDRFPSCGAFIKTMTRPPDGDWTASVAVLPPTGRSSQRFLRGWNHRRRDRPTPKIAAESDSGARLIR